MLNLAHYLNSTLINGALYLVSLPLIALMAYVFTLRFGKGWRPFWVTAALQLVFTLTVPFLLFAEVDLGSAISAPIIAAVVFGASLAIIALFGLATYPIVFLLMYRPRLWHNWTVGLLFVYAVALVPFYGPLYFHFESLYEKYQARRITAELYGHVGDVDGKPLSGATVLLDGCGFYKSNPLTTDSDGRFHVEANCHNELRVQAIEHPQQGPCLVVGETGIAGARGITFVHRGQHEATPDWPYWGNYSKRRPYRLSCVRDMPRDIKQTQGYFSNLAGDGRPYTLVLRDNKYSTLELAEGERPGELYFRLELSRKAAGAPASGRILIQSIDGGVQLTEDKFHFLAPAEGYRPSAELLVDGGSKFYKKRYYYHSSPEQGYGAIEVTYNPGTSRHNIRIQLIKNPRSGRVLVAGE